MRFELDPDQQEIAATARALLARHCGPERVRAHAEAGTVDRALWERLSELGWLGIAVAEEAGGLGLGLVELTVLLEELGAACAPVPVLGTTLAALAIQEAGTPAQRERWLPALASGAAVGALGRVTAAEPAPLVPDAGGADVVVLLGAPGEPARLVDGADVRPVATIDPTRRYGRVAVDGGEDLDGDAAVAGDRALVAVAAELVGLSQRALDLSVAYVRDRRQFGVAVGAFQAVSHRAADMLLAVETGRAAVQAAAWAADAAPTGLPAAAAAAKAWASAAGKDVTGAAIQLHGGIGFTWEADVHWLYKRALLDATYLGGAAEQRRRVAGSMAAS